MAYFTGCIGTHASVLEEGKVPTCYVAADEVDWNYAPSGTDKMTAMDFMGGPHRIGTAYWKAIYRAYTDGSFNTLKPGSRQSGALDVSLPCCGTYARRQMVGMYRVEQ